MITRSPQYETQKTVFVSVLGQRGKRHKVQKTVDDKADKTGKHPLAKKTNKQKPYSSLKCKQHVTENRLVLWRTESKA